MTVGVAIRDPALDTVYVVVDTRATKAGLVDTRPQNKTGSVGSLFFAVSGSATIHRAARVAIQRSVDGLSQPELTSELAHGIAANLRAELIASGWQPDVEEGSVPTFDVNVLLTDGRTLWEYAADLYPQLVEAGQLAAIGSGAWAAWAAYETMQRLGERSPLERATHAAAVAATLVMSCGFPLYRWAVRPGGQYHRLVKVTD